MMQIVELVLRNSLGSEISRHPMNTDPEGDLNLPYAIHQDRELSSILTILNVGDTLAVEERWTEAD